MLRFGEPVLKFLPALFLVLLVSCAHSTHVLTTPAPPREDSHADSPFEAAEYFREQRVPGNQWLPIERYASALRRARLMPRLAHEVPNSPGPWQFLGPGNVGGRTRGIVIHPRDANTIWIGGATGGVWKTTDGGQSWQPTSDFLPALSISSLVIDPTDPNTLYAGTGEQTQNWRGAGIYKTTDGGLTWNQLPSTAGPDFYFVNNIAISPAAPTHLYAATNTGIWASFDAGASWTASLASSDGGPAPTLTGGTTNGCYDVLVPPGQPADMVFAVCHPPGSVQYAIWRNPDAAGSGAWTVVHADPRMWYTVLTAAPSLPGTIYAVSVTSETGPYSKALLAVFRSASNGDPGTWETRASNLGSGRLNTAILSIGSAYNFFSGFCNSPRPNLAGQAGYNLSIAVDPLDADRVWVAGVGLFRSDDGGLNWGFASTGAHPDQHGLAFDPGYDGASNQVLYALNDGGIYKTTQARGAAGTCSAPLTTVTWSPLNNGYGTTQFYHGVPYPGGGTFFGGTQDNGTVRGFEALGINQWDFVYGGDGGVSRIDPANASTLFVEYVHGALAKSTDGGNTYTAAVNGLDESDSNNFPFVAWYVFDPAASRRMYLGGVQLWRTEDAAAHWSAASAPVDQPASGLENIRSIAVSPADSNLVLFGTNRGRIFRHDHALSSGGDTVWPYTQLRAGNVSHLEFDPQIPATVYATYTSFNSAPGDQHIYRSTDTGITWTGIDANLPDVPVQTLLVDPDDNSRLYAGTDLGLFVSSDAGNSWARDESPFANAIIMNLAIERNAGTKYLFAFTYGRGVWRLALSAGNAAACNYSLSPSTIDSGPAGGTWPVDVSTLQDCTWSAAPTVTALDPFASAEAPAFGTGSGTASVLVAPNFSTSARDITLLIQNQPLHVTQTAPDGVVLGDEPSLAFPFGSVPNAVTALNLLLTAGSSDPRHSCTGSANFRTGWASFTAPADGAVRISVESIRLDTNAGNSGVAVTAYPIDRGSIGSELACAAVLKDAGPPRPAVIDLAVTAGASYAIEVAALSSGAASDNARVYLVIGSVTR